MEYPSSPCRNVFMCSISTDMEYWHSSFSARNEQSALKAKSFTASAGLPTHFVFTVVVKNSLTHTLVFCFSCYQIYDSSIILPTVLFDSSHLSPMCFNTLFLNSIVATLLKLFLDWEPVYHQFLWSLNKTSSDSLYWRRGSGSQRGWCCIFLSWCFT